MTRAKTTCSELSSALRTQVHLRLEVGRRQLLERARVGADLEAHGRLLDALDRVALRHVDRLNLDGARKDGDGAGVLCVP